MARIVAKANGSIDLYRHLDPNANLIGDGKPFASAYHGNKTDLDMGKMNLRESNFPQAVFEWIACASRHSRKKHNIPISPTDTSTTKTPVTPVTPLKPTPTVNPEEEFREGQRSEWCEARKKEGSRVLSHDSRCRPKTEASSNQEVHKIQRSPTRRRRTHPLRHGGRRMTWDLFISHTSEDKVDVARPMADLLQTEGVTVWYDEYTLKPV